MGVLFTIGHSTRSLDELVVLLRDGPVETLCDVRRFPGSKRHPHLGRDDLEASLAQRSVRYEWWGEALGGRRKRKPGSRHHAWRNASFQGYADHMDGKEYRSAIEELERRIIEERIAVMCAELLWWRCHRRLIADTFTIRGHEVVHLVDPSKRQPHTLHPNLRADPEGWPVYDVNADVPLDLS